MGNIHIESSEEQEEKIKTYILSISKKMDIDNCKSMVNTFMGCRYTTKSLTQYCDDNNIPYFKRGQYDIFTLEEIEYIKSCITDDSTVDDIYSLFKKEYPNRYLDIEFAQFKTKLEKLKILKSEEDEEVRYTNEVIEYVRNISQDFPKEKVLDLLNISYPRLKMTEELLNNMGNDYSIEFFNSGDYGIFTLGEYKTFTNLTRTCKDLKELFEIFKNKYPNKFNTYDDFCKEANKLEVMKIFNDNVMEHTVFNNNEEDKFVLDLLNNGMSVSNIYLEYGKKFTLSSTKINYISFKSKCAELRKQLNKSFTDEDEKLLSNLANGQRTLKQIITEFENISKTRCTEQQFRYKLKQIGASVKSGLKDSGGRTKKYTDTFIADLRETAKEHTLNECVDILQSKYPEYDLKYKMLHLLCTRNNIEYKKSVVGRCKGMSKSTGRGYTSEYLNYLIYLGNTHTMAEACEILKGSKYADTYKISISHLQNVKSRYGISFKKSNNTDIESVEQPVEKIKLYKLDEIKELAENHTSNEVLKILNERYNTDKFNIISLRSFASKNNIKFAKITELDEEDCKYIIELKNNGFNKQKLYIEYCKKFPKKMSAPIFYNAIKNFDIYVQNNFPHLSNINKIVVHSTDGTKPEISDLAQTDTVPEVITSDIWHPQVTELAHIENTELNDKVDVEPQSITNNSMSKYQPIIDEVNYVFERKCRQLKKEADTHLHTQELINVLKLLQNYAKNTTELTNICNDHDDILEQYVREVEHEIENLPFQDEDPTLQNKIKVIRMRRREAKYVKDDMEVLKPILDVIREHSVKFNNIISNLEQKMKDRENFIFIPIVDVDMCKRYDWCKQGSLYSQKVRTPILTTNKKLSKKSVDNSKKFRAKAEYMAFGNGKPFTDVYYDVFANNSEDARAKATTYFDNLSKSHNNSKYTIQDIYQLNT